MTFSKLTISTRLPRLRCNGRLFGNEWNFVSPLTSWILGSGPTSTRVSKPYMLCFPVGTDRATSQLYSSQLSPLLSAKSKLSRKRQACKICLDLLNTRRWWIWILQGKRSIRHRRRLALDFYCYGSDQISGMFQTVSCKNRYVMLGNNLDTKSCLFMSIK